MNLYKVDLKFCAKEEEKNSKSFQSCSQTELTAEEAAQIEGDAFDSVAGPSTRPRPQPKPKKDDVVPKEFLTFKAALCKGSTASRLLASLDTQVKSLQLRLQVADKPPQVVDSFVGDLNKNLLEIKDLQEQSSSLLARHTNLTQKSSEESWKVATEELVVAAENVNNLRKKVQKDIEFINSYLSK